MNECWGAFALSLISPDYLTPEKAFECIDKGKPREQFLDKCHRDITNQDVADMVQMKESMTYKQIGDIYGMNPGTVYTRIRRFKGII